MRRFSAWPCLRAMRLRLARGYLASRLSSATGLDPDIGERRCQSLGERFETNAGKRKQQIRGVEVTMGHGIVSRRWNDRDRSAQVRGNDLGDGAKGVRSSSREIEEPGRAARDDLEDEIDGVVHVQVVARLLTCAEQRNAAVIDRLAQEAVGAVGIMGVAGAIERGEAQDRKRRLS